jgi:hypothetical protein
VNNGGFAQKTKQTDGKGDLLQGAAGRELKKARSQPSRKAIGNAWRGDHAGHAENHMKSTDSASMLIGNELTFLETLRNLRMAFH